MSFFLLTPFQFITRSNPSQKFVIKEIVIGHLKPAAQQAAKTEADVLHQMAHSNITMYIESFVENAKLYIVMEFADGGDLCGAVVRRRESGKKWGESEVMRIFVQICLALKHVHEANILHRDLKSQNIFLTLKGVVKLGDFGIAKMLDTSIDKASTTIGLLSIYTYYYHHYYYCTFIVIVLMFCVCRNTLLSITRNM
jgi:NIMA (never in mitosis gene a)-related kinase